MLNTKWAGWAMPTRDHDPLNAPDLRLWHRMLCVLLSYIFLVGPEAFQYFAQAATQYSSISRASWGNTDDVFSYTYDANGSREYKFYGNVDVENYTPQQLITNYPTVAYDHHIYNLRNRLTRVEKYNTSHVLMEVVEYQYDTAGVRIGKLVNDTTQTDYLIDPYNHTGYAQVIQETTDDGTNLTRIQYTIGDDVISQTKSTYSSSTWTASSTQYLLYDGHGSTRQLVDNTGAVVTGQQYNYDAYGVMLGDSITPHPAQSAATNLLYSGEQYDSNLDQYYLRARYYNQNNGLFNQTDPYAGNIQDPQSLHKYLYCHNNPVNGIDPTGEFTVVQVAITVAIVAIFAAAITYSIKAHKKTTSDMKIIHPVPTFQELYHNAARWGVTYDQSRQIMYLTDDYLFAAMQESYARHFHGSIRNVAYNLGIGYFSTAKDYVSDIMRDADSVFFDFGENYRGWRYDYKGEKYNASEVNYIGVGLGFEHFHIPWRHHWVDEWNETGDNNSTQGGQYGGYGHPGTPGEHFWTDYGYEHYNKVVDSLVK
jgi:RHS repeat-associated protein